ncbi:MAG: TlpA disulfide reductase family protein [Bacteroidales bacterium]
MKKSLVLLILVIITISCKKNDSFLVNGHIKNIKQKYIYISRVDINTLTLLDSSKINNKGNFKIRIKSKEPDFYQVGFSSKNFVTLLASPGEKIELYFNGDYLYNDYTVSGSEGSEQVRILDNKLIRTKNSLDSLSSLYEKASKEPGFDSKKSLIEQEYLRIIKEQRKFNIIFIIQNTRSLATIKAIYQKINDNMYVLYDVHDLQYMKIASDSLKRYYPESKHTKALLNDFGKELNQLYSSQLEQLAQSIPKAKLDPSLTDINGKRITLSSLKNRYVLLCFWSSESRDCIVENLQLKEYYKMYHTKGFEIYQIDLDKDESAWRAAVKFDDLPWINTREDDPADPKNARLFNVKALPANYLFNPKGSIIASDLHGKNLQIKLNQIFSK